MTPRQDNSINFFTRRLLGAAPFVIIAAVVALTAASVSLAQISENTSAGAPTESSADIQSRIESQQVALEQERSRAAVLDLEIADAQQYLDQNRLALADANDRLDEARARYDATMGMFESRLSAIYKLGGGEAYSVIFSSEGYGDTLSRLSYLATISENDRKLVNRVKSESEEIQALQHQVDTLKQESAAGLAGLQEQKAQLESQIGAGQKSINDATTELAQAKIREEAEAAQAATAESLNGQIAGLEDSDATVSIGDGPPAGLNPSGIILSGVASWYGPGFNGQRTASGETYNMYAYTAASKTLPFGTWLKVSFNGRSVFVRINDRGPYVGGRILDLSYTAAQALGLDGIGYVTAEIYN